MKKNFCVLVPSLTSTGPILGAIAFVNAICKERNVKLVSLKPVENFKPFVDETVDVICLGDKKKGFLASWWQYRKILLAFGGRRKVLSLSMCFSADLLNLFCGRYAQLFSSVRGNLPMNYKFDYGILGLFLAKIHLLMLNKFDYVSVMSLSMADQVRSYSYKNPLIIGNYIDENTIEKFRKKYSKTKVFTFIFVGSLSPRKHPALLIELIKILNDEGLLLKLKIVGEGELKDELKRLITKYRLNKVIKLYGYVDSPFKLISQADAFILPSFSEGMSRALLEALHLGIPSIVRNVDGSNEVIKPGYNGECFSTNEELLTIMRKFIGGRYPRSNQSLLPEKCRQMKEAFKLVSHVEY